MTQLSTRLCAYIDELESRCRSPLILEDITAHETKRKYKMLPTLVRAFVFIPEDENSYCVVADWQAAACNRMYEAIVAHELGHVWLHAQAYPHLVLLSEKGSQATYERDLINTLVEDPICDSIACSRGFSIDEALLGEFDCFFRSSKPLSLATPQTKMLRIERCVLLVRLVTSEFLCSDQKTTILERFQAYDNRLVEMVLDYSHGVKEFAYSRNKHDHAIRLAHALSTFFNKRPPYLEVKT